MHCGASVMELYGALVFHSTTFSHLQALHITAVSFPGLPPFSINFAYGTVGEKCLGKRLGYQMYACVHDQCSLVCAHLAFVGGLQVKNEDSTSQYASKL